MRNQIARILIACSIVLASLALIPGCNNLTPQQVQTIAATTAATVAIAGTTAQSLNNNKHITNQQIAAITTAAVQASQVIGQAAANWTPAPSPTPTPAPH